ncbi:hypothetical protein [Pseudomonas umsongensis]|uniref:hypothetical protein n=1 Tax=Pseudomonas umsongensis TaxID=198618 RepID=UPI0003806D78|nr:hypothetical protein [Pseudomonas umsongensis]
MGTNEYAVDDGNGNELVIACPAEDGRYVSASTTVNGQVYRSEDSEGFDLIVDGKTFRNPFYTDCRACSSIFANEFWGALLQAKRLQVSAQGTVITLTTQDLKTALPALNDKNNSCQAAW